MQKTLENIFSTSSETFKAYRLLTPSLLLLIIVFGMGNFVNDRDDVQYIKCRTELDLVKTS